MIVLGLSVDSTKVSYTELTGFLIFGAHLALPVEVLKLYRGAIFGIGPGFSSPGGDALRC